MIYLPLSKIHDSKETKVAAGASITAEGQALVRAAGATASGVTPSQGISGEIFAGFSFAGLSAAPLPLSYATKVEKFVVPSSGTVQLAFAPQAGQVLIYDVTTGADVTITGGVTVVGLNVNGLTSGDTVNITYKYPLSVVQARALQGDVQPGGYAGSYVGQVGLITRGAIFIDQFDASKDWSNVAKDAIVLGAGGILTQGGSGVPLTGAYVIAIPSQEVPFLGFEFSAA
jgi:hypothetical protein